MDLSLCSQTHLIFFLPSISTPCTTTLLSPCRFSSFATLNCLSHSSSFPKPPRVAQIRNFIALATIGEEQQLDAAGQQQLEVETASPQDSKSVATIQEAQQFDGVSQPAQAVSAPERKDIARHAQRLDGVSQIASPRERKSGVDSLAQAPPGSLVRAPESKIPIGFFDDRHKLLRKYKGKGKVIADLLMVFGGLLDRAYGGGRPIAAAGRVVMEKLASDVEALRREDALSEKALIGLVTSLKLIEADIDLLDAAGEDETLPEKLESTKLHCKEAVSVALSI